MPRGLIASLLIVLLLATAAALVPYGGTAAVLLEFLWLVFLALVIYALGRLIARSLAKRRPR